jgi:hypothetical protein
MKYKNALIIFILIATFFPTSTYASPGEFANLDSNSKQAQTAKTTKSLIANFRPPNRSQPKYTVGGAVRGNTCAIDQGKKSEITALVPEIEQSLTLQERPSFFAYVSPMNGEKSATLIVKDETEDYYYSQKLTIPATGGMIKMTLAEDAPSLKVGQTYTWFLRIQCNASLEPEDPQISANITRVEGDIPALDREELMSFYADSQLWYDSLNNAFELSQSGKDIYWTQLLSSIGMERFNNK